MNKPCLLLFDRDGSIVETAPLDAPDEYLLSRIAAIQQRGGRVARGESPTLPESVCNGNSVCASVNKERAKRADARIRRGLWLVAGVALAAAALVLIMEYCCNWGLL